METPVQESGQGLRSPFIKVLKPAFGGSHFKADSEKAYSFSGEAIRRLVDQTHADLTRFLLHGRA